MGDNQIISGFLVGNHNAKILDRAVDAINSFQSDGFHLWFYDEEGNVFSPKGEIKYVMAQEFLEDKK